MTQWSIRRVGLLVQTQELLVINFFCALTKLPVHGLLHIQVFIIEKNEDKNNSSPVLKGKKAS